MWSDIARALADLSHKSLEKFWILLFCLVPVLESGMYKHEVGPMTEHHNLADVIGLWLRDSHMRGAGFKEGVDFGVKGIF